MRAYAQRELSALDARVLRATDARYERSPEKIGELPGCAADVALGRSVSIWWSARVGQRKGWSEDGCTERGAHAAPDG
jgi:hypothetical protein